MEPLNFTREQIYDLVWTKSLSAAATNTGYRRRYCGSFASNGSNGPVTVATYSIRSIKINPRVN